MRYVILFHWNFSEETAPGSDRYVANIILIAN